PTSPWRGSAACWRPGPADAGGCPGPVSRNPCRCAGGTGGVRAGARWDASLWSRDVAVDSQPHPPPPSSKWRGGAEGSSFLPPPSRSGEGGEGWGSGPTSFSLFRAVAVQQAQFLRPQLDTSEGGQVLGLRPPLLEVGAIALDCCGRTAGELADLVVA